MLAIALALGSSACYGVSNFLGPQLAKRQTLVAVLVWSQVAALVLCAAYVLGDPEAPLPAEPMLVALLAGVGNAGGLIGFYRAAELGPLAVAAPIGALGAVVPAVWGVATGDQLAAHQVLGLVLALGGAALAARRSPPEDRSGPTYEDPRASVVWAAGSAVMFGIFLTALPAAADDGRAWALLDARVALVLVLFAWAGRRLVEARHARGDGPLLTLPGILLVAGTLLYTFAADNGPLSLVSVLGSLFPLVTVGLGVAVLGERLDRVQALGVAAALTGVVLTAV